jgi:hypothetical protein
MESINESKTPSGRIIENKFHHKERPQSRKEFITGIDTANIQGYFFAYNIVSDRKQLKSSRGKYRLSQTPALKFNIKESSTPQISMQSVRMNKILKDHFIQKASKKILSQHLSSSLHNPRAYDEFRQVRYPTHLLTN